MNKSGFLEKLDTVYIRYSPEVLNYPEKILDSDLVEID